jgi:hypothetical protein
MTKTDQLLEVLTKSLEQHISDEEDTLGRIEKLLNGNGQPGLVHEHISNGARLNTLTEKITGLEIKLEVMRVETVVARRWALGIGLSALSVLIAIIALLIRLEIKP